VDIRGETFGKTPEGVKIEKFNLSNDQGLTASVTNFGAILTSLTVPNRSGRSEEVTLGFDTLEGYLADIWFFGATIGRYANRIAKGKFSLDGTEYQLAQNSPPSHLHGGPKGFHKWVWSAETRNYEDSISVVFSRLSPDGEEGYPGNLSVTVTYTLNNRNELAIDYRAETDKTTPINLTNHTYWNLKGVGNGDVLEHLLTLHAESYLPTDEDRIPTGELRAVQGTPMDFTRPVKIGARIDQVTGGGYNHCYVLKKGPDPLSLAASVYEPFSGRVMEIYTTEPGIQFYSGHFLKNYRGARGILFNKYDGFCLEAQRFPNSVNTPQFPSTLLRPGKLYRQRTLYQFSLK
jgi:aldose 1-epimerase